MLPSKLYVARGRPPRPAQAAERDACQAVRDSEWEGREIARARAGLDQNIALEVPYWDVARGKVRRGRGRLRLCHACCWRLRRALDGARGAARLHTSRQADDSDDEPPDEGAAAADYLTPFLPPGLGAGGLTREQCLGARERCLRALKDRLVERANIIQAGGGACGFSRLPLPALCCARARAAAARRKPTPRAAASRAAAGRRAASTTSGPRLCAARPRSRATATRCRRRRRRSTSAAARRPRSA